MVLCNTVQNFYRVPAVIKNLEQLSEEKWFESKKPFYLMSYTVYTDMYWSLYSTTTILIGVRRYRGQETCAGLYI